MKPPAQKQSHSEVTAAFLKNRDGLIRYLSFLLRNKQDAEDVSQEVFICAYRASQKRKIEKPKPFLYQIARNTALTELKKKSASIIRLVGVIGDEHEQGQGNEVEQEITEEEKMEMLTEAVSTLPPQCRRVFILKKINGYSQKEISELLGISTSTVEKHLASALKKCISHASKHKSNTDVVYLENAKRKSMREE